MATIEQRKFAMIRISRTDSNNQDFIQLVRSLDADLAERDGNEHVFSAQFNIIDGIKHVVVAYEGNRPIGCGAIKEDKPRTKEVKRMYTVPASRGKGTASQVIAELEKCVLETGKKKPEAIEFYNKNGDKGTLNHGQYTGLENSMCFEKSIP